MFNGNNCTVNLHIAPNDPPLLTGFRGLKPIFWSASNIFEIKIISVAWVCINLLFIFIRMLCIVRIYRFMQQPTLKSTVDNLNSSFNEEKKHICSIFNALRCYYVMRERELQEFVCFFLNAFLYKNAACKKVKCARKFLLLCFHYGSLEPWVSVGIEINQLPFSAIPMWLSFYLLYFGWMLNEMKWRKKAHTHFHCTVSFWLFELCAINSSLLIKLINHSSKLKRVSFLN